MSDAFTEFRNPAAIALTADICMRALDARDARFDGLFFVGITSTRVYCRPVCPARVAYPGHRRFFDTAAAAERAGFRPCLRCRPELAPGRALIDAVSRLAVEAAHRIQAGALNGRTVADLARELGVSDRHLRRAIERQLGVSPVELAQTHRLLLAKQLLADTRLSITRVAFASGFQSLRRFNAIFRERYRMPPSIVRRTADSAANAGEKADDEPVRLSLAYRPPLAWNELLASIAGSCLPGVERIEAGRYARTIRIESHRGVVIVENGSADRSKDSDARGRRRSGQPHVNAYVSPSLLPVLMPLLAQLRRLFDLDADPTVVDGHLTQDGLATFVRQLPGLRVPGGMEGFEVALGVALRGAASSGNGARLTRRVVRALGEPFVAGVPGLDRLAPDAARVAEAGASRLRSLGVPQRGADTIARLARLVADGAMRLYPGCDVDASYRTLRDSLGLDERLATMIVMRALSWPDAFPISPVVMREALATEGCDAPPHRAERWRPWRAYAAMHILHASATMAETIEPGTSHRGALLSEASSRS